MRNCVAAISGGADSMALLHRLLDAGDRPTVCHVDHGVRPGSADDARWVQARCADLGVACVVRSVVPVSASEADMRHARYAALLEVAVEVGADEVLTGHTLDDQAETVLLRMARGTRLKGLGAMAARRPLGQGVELVRPLLAERRKALRHGLEERGVAWLEDPSNGDDRYARNRLRDAPLPVPAEVLARVADAARLAYQRLDGPWDGDLDTLAALPRAARRIRLDRFVGGQLEEAHLVALEELASQSAGSTAVSLSGGRTAVREYRRLRVLPLPISNIDLTFSIVPRSEGRPPAANAAEAWFDADSLRFPLTVRVRNPGDRIRPFGGRGRRKIQDVLVDAKVPRASRDSLLMVCQGDDVIWVPGVIRANAAAVRSSTRRVLRIRRGAR